MGHICGGKHIIGLPALAKAHEKELRKQAEELSRKEVMRQGPSEALEQLDRWLPFAEALDGFVSGLRMHCRALYDELVARSHKGGRGREVTIRDTQWWRTRKEKRIGRPNDRRLALAGFEVLNPVIAPRNVRRLRDQVRSFVSTVRVREPALVEAEALWKEWTALKKSVDAVVSKLEGARRMFSEENLNLLVLAARDGVGHVPAGIRVEGTFYNVGSIPVGLDLQRYPGA
jgi:hypothetical protein